MTINKITSDEIMFLGATTLGWWFVSTINEDCSGDMKLVSGEWILEELLK